jgi:succinate dehydrogenase / fumarate reductase cytochrome b subunit
MKWLIDLLSSTLGKKLIMALTGLFLISFLIVHLMGNLQLLKNDGGRAFNIYAQFMTTNPLIKTISYALYTSIVIHTLWAILLTRLNRKARGSQGYAVANKSSHWTSRSMGLLGSLIFIFIVIHMRQFWAEMHWGGISTVNYDGHEVKDLYKVVMLAYQEIGYVVLYVVSMAVLAFHLFHGFASAFQTLGLNHQKYNGLIRGVGQLIAIVIPVLFAVIPVMMYLGLTI